VENPAASNEGIAQTAMPISGATQASVRSDLELLHDVGHQVHLIREALQSEKRRLGFFLGAGCPLGIYTKDGKESLKHIPDVAGLTTAVGAALDRDGHFKDSWAKLTAACKTDKVPIPNVEHILTQLRTICALKGTTQFDGMTPDELRNLDTKICELIANTVGKGLPEHTNSYHRLAAWISHIDRVSPVEVFTPNYDLLLEEALEQYNVPFFDGFVGAREPFFDLAAMEQDALPPRWTRLWKLHGSIIWIKRTDGSVFRCHPAKEGQQLLIYPSHLKYEQSRRMPYLAMIDRLRAFFRDTNPILVVCGYSFTDDDLNEVLLDGLRGNRSAHCFALMHPGIQDCETVASHASKHANLSVLAWDGAVIGTRRGSYKPIDRSAIAPGVGFDAAPQTEDALGENVGAGQCRLGDFHHFALFLETQFGVKANDQQGTEAR
jgi:hypothetical protein